MATMATTNEDPSSSLNSPTEKNIKFEDNLARPSTTSSGSQLQDEEVIEYDSDPEHAQDWTKTTDPKDSWAVRERRRSSKFGKGPNMPNPHADSGKDRRGSVLSLFQTGKNDKGQDVIHSGFKDHPENWVPEKSKESRSMSNSSGGRRGSVLSMFQTGKDAKGRHVMNSGEWDDMD